MGSWINLSSSVLSSSKCCQLCLHCLQMSLLLEWILLGSWTFLPWEESSLATSAFSWRRLEVQCLYVMPRGSAMVLNKTEAGTNGPPEMLLVWLFSVLFAPKLSQKRGLTVPILYFFIADMLHISGRKPFLIVVQKTWHCVCRGSFAAAWEKDLPPEALVEMKTVTILDSFRSKEMQ